MRGLLPALLATLFAATAHAGETTNVSLDKEIDNYLVKSSTQAWDKPEKAASFRAIRAQRTKP